MKGIAVFIIIALTIYTSASIYIYLNISLAAAFSGTLGWIFRIVLLIMFISYPLGKTLHGIGKDSLGLPFSWIGSYWIGVMFYTLLIFGVKDIFLLINHFAGWIPPDYFYTLLASRIYIGVIFGFLFILFIYGTILARNPEFVSYDIAFDNYPADKSPMKMVMVSDVHAGVLIGQKRVEKMVCDINDQQPDIVLIAGDFLDEPVKHLLGMEEILRGINSKHGTYAILGNHEYYYGVEPSIEFLKRSGMKVLLDEGTVIDSSIVLIGLGDLLTADRTGKPVKSLENIINEFPDHLPVVLAEHTPTKVKEIAEKGVDLMLCGHTHGGQIWPASIPAGLANDVLTGIKRINDKMWVIVSNGYGTWGPPIRIGVPPQVVTINFSRS
ncbi:MAG: metallophosphoesterase [Candidatus Electryonea clarkiae]|nr:metallophosphoesterase [Candidatus Electryonea clarkiae]MDP8285435.1 metallophosphoesterase [Candidatus Electryonea clarkiae]